MAEPPEQCTYFRRGDRLETPEKAKQYLEKMRAKALKQQRPKYDWAKAEELYRAGMNDSEIAAAIGCSISGAATWRKRKGLKANAKPGWKRRKT